MDKDIRWKQRFSNYSKAYSKFKIAADFFGKDSVLTSDISDEEIQLMREGLIQRFEYTHELAWKVMKDYAEYQGSADQITGSRDAVRTAFKMGLIDDAEVWMDMISNRNRTSHTYDESTAEEILHSILDSYNLAFAQFEKKMEAMFSK